MSASHQPAVDAFKKSQCHDENLAIIDSYLAEGDDEGKHVAMKDAFLSSCFKHGYAYEAEFHVKSIGGMASNRNHEGLLAVVLVVF